MSKFNQFIVGNKIPSITYQTKLNPESVCPRVVYIDDVPMIYNYKERTHITVPEFFNRLASRETGFQVTGYRENGRQTTLTFDQWERVSLTPEVEKYLNEIRSH